MQRKQTTNPPPDEAVRNPPQATATPPITTTSVPPEAEPAASAPNCDDIGTSAPPKSANTPAVTTTTTAAVPKAASNTPAMTTTTTAAIPAAAPTASTAATDEAHDSTAREGSAPTTTAAILGCALRVGDVLFYRSLVFVSGDKRGERLSAVAGITGDPDYPLVMQNGEVLPSTQQVKLVQQFVDGKLVDCPNQLFWEVGEFDLTTFPPSEEGRNQKSDHALALAESISAFRKKFQALAENTGMPIDLLRGASAENQDLNLQENDPSNEAEPQGNEVLHEGHDEELSDPSNEAEAQNNEELHEGHDEEPSEEAPPEVDEELDDGHGDEGTVEAQNEEAGESMPLAQALLTVMEATQPLSSLSHTVSECTQALSASVSEVQTQIAPTYEDELQLDAAQFDTLFESGMLPETAVLQGQPITSSSTTNSTSSEESDEDSSDEETDEASHEYKDMGNTCCCGCGLDATLSNHYCSVSERRVMAWCYSADQEMEEGFGRRGICKGCDKKPPPGPLCYVLPRCCCCCQMIAEDSSLTCAHTGLKVFLRPWPCWYRTGQEELLRPM